MRGTPFAPTLPQQLNLPSTPPADSAEAPPADFVFRVCSHLLPARDNLGQPSRSCRHVGVVSHRRSVTGNTVVILNSCQATRTCRTSLNHQASYICPPLGTRSGRPPRSHLWGSSVFPAAVSHLYLDNPPLTPARPHDFLRVPLEATAGASGSLSCLIMGPFCRGCKDFQARRTLDTIVTHRRVT